MEFTTPLADAISTREKGDVIARTRRFVIAQGWSDLANNTKWNRLITTMRTTDRWKPYYRYKCLDGEGYVSMWECEWWFHLPLPFVTALWFDIGYLQKHRRGPFAIPKVTDHSDWIESLLQGNGFEYRKGINYYRIFGYYPLDMDRFEEAESR